LRGLHPEQTLVTVMRKALWSFITGIMLITTACATTAEKHAPDNSPWSAKNPLDIPYRTRHEQLKKGNLAPNPSFEEGRYFTDGREDSFALPGWEQVGPNVKWTDRDQDTDKIKGLEPNRRCITIHRAKATELDDAEGVLSAFIPVVPGNYEFNYNVRLNAIRSNKRRLGVKLLDAIVIKILFFDADRKPVDSAQTIPTDGGLVDSSDKSFSFSHYWHIDTFPWGRVKGRTYNYPYSEGDIPTRTRYVRLFFGLKGTGIMQVDDIYFGYSKWNFTALERFQPLFDKRLTITETLIPTPKHLQAEGLITYYDTKSPPSHLPVIVLPEEPAPAEMAAAKLLQTKLDHVLEAHNPSNDGRSSQIRILTNHFSQKAIYHARLILSIGRNSLYQRLKPHPPSPPINNHEQGYILQTVRSGSNHIVFLLGETPVGTYNAATTAVQLFEDDAFIFHRATVVDYPDFLGRAYVLRNWQSEKELQIDLDAIERMSLFKFNKVYFGYNRSKKNWYEPDELYRRGLAEVGRRLDESGAMRLALMVNPYAHLPMEASLEDLNDGMRHTWTHNSPESLTTLKNVYRIGLEAGADTLMLLADDFMPHTGTNPQNYTLYTDDDRYRFVNLQNAHAYIINRLKDWIDAEYPGTRLEFCPPWYSNEHIDRSAGRAERYLEELSFQIPSEVAIIWTGPTIRSLSIDMADLHRFQSLIGRWPMLWDNTLYARNLETPRYGGYTTHYPDKVAMCNLFEPYDTTRPNDFHQYNDGRHCYINAPAYTEVYRLKYATVADYLWNTAAYNPEHSLWKILVRTYGPASAENLIRFSDAYYNLYGLCRRIEIGGACADAFAKGRKSLIALNDYLGELSRALPEAQRLLGELRYFRDKQKVRFEKRFHDKCKVDSSLND
jgi:hypothetical protein